MESVFECPISGESEKEERINFATHLLGFVLSLVGWTVLMIWVSPSKDSLKIGSNFIYGATLTILYLASTLYHGCKSSEQKRKLKIVDHVCIYLLIAGCYTPFMLGPLLKFGGIQLLCIIWLIAVTGIILKVVAINRFKALSILFYLSMGWLVIFSIPDLFEHLSYTTLVWLILGGLSYTLGILFYLLKKLPFNHGIWHIFVLFGSICHYFSIFSLAE